MRLLPVLALLCACTGGEEEPVSCASDALPDFDLAAKAGIRQELGGYTTPWDGASRELDLHIWYPTADGEGEAAEYLELFEDEHSLLDASYAEAESSCTHPLLVYSHGSQAWAGGGNPLIRQFVRAGWVAIGADHKGNTLDENLDPRPLTFDLTRVLDVRAAIDHLEDLPEEDPLFGRVDTSRAFVFGHSYGGQTAWLMGGPTLDMAAVESMRCADQCTEAELAAYAEGVGDPRVVAVAPMAGQVGDNLVAADGFADIDVPVLYMTGSEDFDGQPHFDRAAAVEDLTWVEIEGGCHETFTATELPCAGVDKEEGLRIVSTYLTALGWQAVLGVDEGSGVLDGSTEVSGLVTLSR